MAYQPEIVPSSPTGQALQAAIQKKLAEQGWSSEDDAVMAEYCLVMLGNKKTPDQISSELSDLIGGDFESSFVTWLFEELARHYPDPSAAPPADQQSASPAQQQQQQQQQGRARPPPPHQPANMFGAAISGVKRDFDSQNSNQDRPQQRARYDRPGFDGVPAGPRGQQNGRNGGGPSGGRNDGNKTIFDRVGGGGGSGGAPQFAQGGPSPAPGMVPFPQQGGGGGFMTPQQAMQAQAMAMAQAFAAMQGWTAPPGQGGPPFPANFGPNGFVPQPFPNQQNGNNRFPNNNNPNQNQNFRNNNGNNHKQPFSQNQQQQHPRQQKNSNPPAPAAPLPTKPLEEAICKHGVDCSKPTCPYSHPSPVATKETGLVLSSEACEKQLACEDADCPKSHVSASQKKASTSAAAAAGGAPSGPSAAVAPTPAPPSRPAPPADPYAIPGAGEKSCKFAGACTRPGCVFLHPWDVKGDPGNTAGVACRWGQACTRADCHFSHPPGRQVYKGPKKPAYGAPASYGAAKSYSATFNNPKNPSIGAWPTEPATHVSDRLKRFAGGNGGVGGAEATEEGAERIIPGQGQQQEQDGDKHDKVEILLEDDVSSPAQAAEVKEGGSTVV